MTPQQAGHYIGTPWVLGAEGPEAYDCWGLLRHVEREYFNVDMPQITSFEMVDAASMFQEKVESGAWVQNAFPQHGDGALLREGNEPHVGIYLDIDGGGILQSIRGVGVVFTPLRNLRTMGYSRVKYYRLLK